MNQASTQTPTDSGWTHRLAFLLLSGIDRSQAVARCTADGVSVELVESQASTLLASPLFRRMVVANVQLQCRNWILHVYATLAALEGSTALDERRSLSRDEFISGYYCRNRAVYFPGIAADWPATARWNREYLSQACGDMHVEVMFGRESAAVPDQNVAADLRRTMRFADYVDLVYGGGESNDYYLVSRNAFFSQPGAQRLLADIQCPPYVRLDNPEDAVRMWFGPSATVTPLHYDDLNQVAIQVIGRKKVRLYPPYYSAAMKQEMWWYAAVDPAATDRAAHAAAATAAPIECYLNPGDGLFIPVGWWHAIQSEAVSITLTFRDFGVANVFR